MKDYSKSINNFKIDKILNNSYNEGEQNHEDLGSTMKIHNSVYALHEDQLGENIIETRVLKMLDNELYQIFSTSPYFEKYKKPKRADSIDRIKMYYYFKQKLENQKQYSDINIFIAFAEFFQVNYEQLYSELCVLDKENILKELNEKYGLTHKIKTKRLF